MNEFVLLLLIGCVWIWGVYCPFSDGYAFAKVGDWVRSVIPMWLYKPLFGCPPCMSSAHGFFISAIYYDWHIYPMAAYIVCLCGLNFIIKSILFPEYE